MHRATLVLALASSTLVGCAARVSPPFTAGGGCTGEEHRALDFWLGEWDVKTQAGELAGRNVISKTLGGCAIEERWTDASGAEGRSLFHYDRAIRRWKQLWITDDGHWKEKTEVPGAVEGAVRFEGMVPQPAGGTAIDRTTLSRDGATVSQRIEKSTDGGKTWASWTGVYSRREPKDTCRGAHRQLDFWVGDWDVVVKARPKPDAPWVEQRGRNRVTRVLDGCGIEESFSATGGASGDWAGKSLSRFVDAEGKWRQTWIDDGGGYMPFVGEKRGGDVVLVGEPKTALGVTTVMRMVFTNITEDSFLWRWEASKDGGSAWETKMTIEYRRRLATRPFGERGTGDRGQATGDRQC
jgi:hypothetical protein